MALMMRRKFFHALVFVSVAMAFLDLMILHERLLRETNLRSKLSSAAAAYNNLRPPAASFDAMDVEGGGGPNSQINQSRPAQQQPITSTSSSSSSSSTLPPPAASKSKAEQQQQQQQQQEEVVQIVPIPLQPEKIKASSIHLIQDGVRESPRLNFTQDIKDFGPNVVWMLDQLAVKEEWDDDWCDMVTRIIKAAQRLRRRKANVKSTQWPIYLVDNRDYPYINKCQNISSLVGLQNVKYSYRASVVRRAWSKRKDWVRVGREFNPLQDNTSEDEQESKNPMYNYQQIPIGVRTDTVEAIDSVLRQRGNQLCDPIEKLDRTTHVSYFWESTEFSRNDAHLRDTVYDILDELSTKRKADWNISVGLKGQSARRGRKRVSWDYVEAMLNSKIVVVAQRDYWEDHYRLFEAIVSGALVLTDQMHPLPQGLQNGISVVEYTDADELRAKIAYYLNHADERIEIARRGREVAMSRHRSWHHMEEIVFGAPVTVCSSKSNSGSRCPYVVHVNEMNQTCERDPNLVDNAR